MENYTQKCSVAVLLCTFNGEKFVEEQINSIVTQTHKNTKIFISDDNSSDNTVNILRELQKRFPQTIKCIFKGPCAGHFSANFFALMTNSQISADFYALCDQYDIWQPKKIEVALDRLLSLKNSKPNVYGSRTELINSFGDTIGFSPLFKKQPRFANAVVQNIAGGNTMVFNHKAKLLFENTLSGVPVLPSHDWTIYQLITGAGGVFFYDPVPRIKYRQHVNNLIGSNQGFYAKLQRLAKLFNGDFKNWNDANLRFLRINEKFLTKEAVVKVRQFEKLRKHRLYGIEMILRCAIYRQTIFGHIALLLGALLKKL